MRAESAVCLLWWWRLCSTAAAPTACARPPCSSPPTTPPTAVRWGKIFFLRSKYFCHIAQIAQAGDVLSLTTQHIGDILLNNTEALEPGEDGYEDVTEDEAKYTSSEESGGGDPPGFESLFSIVILCLIIICKYWDHNIKLNIKYQKILHGIDNIDVVINHIYFLLTSWKCKPWIIDQKQFIGTNWKFRPILTIFCVFSLLEALHRHQQDTCNGQNILIRSFQVSRRGGGRGQLLRPEEEREERDGELFRGRSLQHLGHARPQGWPQGSLAAASAAAVWAKQVQLDAGTNAH